MAAPETMQWTFTHAAVLEEARAAGLLEAAKRAAGVISTTKLGLLALALLAKPDPVVSAMRRTRGRLAADHQIDS